MYLTWSGMEMPAMRMEYFQMPNLDRHKELHGMVPSVFLLPIVTIML